LGPYFAQNFASKFGQGLVLMVTSLEGSTTLSAYLVTTEAKQGCLFVSSNGPPWGSTHTGAVQQQHMLVSVPHMYHTPLRPGRHQPMLCEGSHLQRTATKVRRKSSQLLKPTISLLKTVSQRKQLHVSQIKVCA